jgi:hypothetical protein
MDKLAKILNAFYHHMILPFLPPCRHFSSFHHHRQVRAALPRRLGTVEIWSRATLDAEQNFAGSPSGQLRPIGQRQASRHAARLPGSKF